jgi:hypothetical protein
MVECRICLEVDALDKFISPCRCNGSAKWVHEECLQTWRSGNTDNENFTTCEICNTEYMLGHYKPMETHIIQIPSFSFSFEILGCFLITGIGGIFIYMIDGYTNYISLKIFNIDGESLHLRRSISKNDWSCWAYYQGMCGFILSIFFFTYFYFSLYFKIKQKFRYFKLVFFKNLLFMAISFNFLYILYFAKMFDDIATLSIWSPILTSMLLNIGISQIRFHNRKIVYINNNNNIGSRILSVQYNPIITVEINDID